MAIPPWTIELLRRGLSDAARKASEPATFEKIKNQASEILQDLPQTAARGIDAVVRSAEAGKKSVERWSRKHTTLAIPILNASGVLISDYGTGVPLAAPAAEVGAEFLLGDTISSGLIRDRFERRLQKLLPAGGGQAIAVTSNFSAALTAFSLLVRQRQLVVHRSHAVRLPDGRPLPEAFGTLLPVIQEVGGTDGVREGDFNGLDSFCAIMADDGRSPAEPIDFGSRDAYQAVVLPVATLASTAFPDIPSAEAMLTAGADFVIMPGDGICGGPPSGILIGPESEVQRIRSCAAWDSLKANDAIEAMTLVTLELAASHGDAIPVRSLLATGEENLRGRAERLATRLSGSDRIKTCQVTAEEARLSSGGRWRLPSRQVRLRHESMSAATWRQELIEDSPSVIANVDGDDLCLDLRWIAAADDAKLGEAIGGRIDL